MRSQTVVHTFKRWPKFCAPCSTGQHDTCRGDDVWRCECGETGHVPNDRVAAAMRLFNRLDLDGDTIENLALEYRERYAIDLDREGSTLVVNESANTVAKTCNEHPWYKGDRRSRTGCSCCADVYDQRKKEKANGKVRRVHSR